MEELITILAGATGAAAIKLIDGVIQWYLKRKDKEHDVKEQADVEQDLDIQSIKKGMRIMLLDRIQYLCKAYIKQGWVDYDDRRRLHLMHDVYHDNGGNGDLDLLMHDVDQLPIKEGRCSR